MNRRSLLPIFIQGSPCAQTLASNRLMRDCKNTREYVDEGVSGSTDKRPALDELLRGAKRRRFDLLVCWRLDRLGRNLRHVILLLEKLHAQVELAKQGGVSRAAATLGISRSTVYRRMAQASGVPSR